MDETMAAGYFHALTACGVFAFVAAIVLGLSVVV
jgi:hypothetical protein